MARLIDRMARETYERALAAGHSEEEARRQGQERAEKIRARVRKNLAEWDGQKKRGES